MWQKVYSDENLQFSNYGWQRKFNQTWVSLTEKNNRDNQYNVMAVISIRKELARRILSEEVYYNAEISSDRIIFEGFFG